MAQSRGHSTLGKHSKSGTHAPEQRNNAQSQELLHTDLMGMKMLNGAERASEFRGVGKNLQSESWAMRERS